MRNSIRRYLELCTETLPLPGPVYEFGSLQVEGSGEDIDIRGLFPSVDFIGCDMRAGPGVDQVIDLHQMDLPDHCAGTVLSLDTLEHVEYPRQAMDEIYRILRPGGIAIISSVMRFPIHAYPNDYWRFTPEGFRSLLKPFEHSFVGSCGGTRDFPQTIVGLGFKATAPDLAEYQRAYARWAKFNDKIDEKLLPLEKLEFN